MGEKKRKGKRLWPRRPSPAPAGRMKGCGARAIRAKRGPNRPTRRPGGRGRGRYDPPRVPQRNSMILPTRRGRRLGLCAEGGE